MNQRVVAIIASLIFYCISVEGQTALHFNGVNNIVQTTVAPVLNNQSRTVDTWINTSFSPSTQIVICDWGTFSPLGSRFTLNVTTNRLRIEVGGVGITGNQLVTTGQWLHVTAVYESSITTGNNVFLYVNGVLDAAGTFTGYPVLTTSNATNLRIGARVDGINLFNGAIDELKVYNYARTAAQIASDTVEYCAPVPGLVAYYKLNEGIPNSNNTGSVTAIDYSGNGNNGTLNSFTLTGTSSNWVPGRVRQNAPNITASPGSTICAGNTLSLSANTANSFTWSTGNSSSTLITVSPTSNSVYSISVLTNQGCLATSSLAVTVSNGIPSLTVSASQNSVCLGAAVTLSASGALSYTWTGGITNNQAFTPSVTTIYSVTATNGCGSSNATRTITVVPLNVAAAASSPSICQGASGILSASATATSYTWMPGPLIGSSVAITPTTSFIYTVTASDGTCRGTNTVLVLSVPSPSLSLSATAAFVCEGQSYSVQASSSVSGVTYTWLPNGGNTFSTVLTPTATTAYTAICSNTAGCQGSAQIVMVVTPAPIFSITAGKTLLCSGQSTTLTASGAGTYTWNSGTTGATFTATPSSPSAIYTATATAANNTCTATRTIEIRIFTPTISLAASHSVCMGSSYTLTASGASSYSWNGGNSGSTSTLVITPTVSTTYTLSTSSTSLTTNCSLTQTTMVNVLALPLVTAVASRTLICKQTDSFLTAGGAVTYTWLPVNLAAPQITVSPVQNTTYTVIGTDGNACQNSATVQVKVAACPGALPENKSVLSLSIFPIPARNYVIIDSEVEIEADLLTLYGELVRRVLLTAGQTQLNLEDLNSGMYMIRLQKGNDQLIKKIILE